MYKHVGFVALIAAKTVTIAPGTARISVHGVPHGAFKATGDRTLKLLTVDIVDKDKPMMMPVKQ